MENINSWENFNDLSRRSGIEYDAEWKRPGNPVREELEVDLRDIFLEIKDLGYRPQLSGFTFNVGHVPKRILEPFKKSKGLNLNKPYVWICNQNRLTHDDFWGEINETVERVKCYLRDKGFKVNLEIVNIGRSNEQVYIYFNY